MAKVKVIKEFRDKDRFSVVYTVGETFEFEAERAQALVKRGLVEVIGRKKRETAEVKEDEAETTDAKETEAETTTDTETTEVKEDE